MTEMQQILFLQVPSQFTAQPKQRATGFVYWFLMSFVICKKEF